MFPNDSDFHTKITLETEKSSLVDDDLPFNVLILGNWRGARNSLNANNLNFRPIEIDRDNFDDVLKKFHCSLDLSFQDDNENMLTLEFSELDDFHPDKIFQQVPLFSNLRDIRKKLSNSNTYNEAAREVRSWLKTSEVEESQKGKLSETAPTGEPPTDNLLDQILGQTTDDSSSTQNTNNVSKELSAFVGKLVKPHLIQTDLEEQSNLLMIVDEITSDLMRKILHHPQFQALESAWRGLYLMVRKIETDNELKIFILDIDKSELAEILKSNDDLTESRFYQVVNDTEKSWAFIGGNFTFGLNVEDAAVLIRLAKIGYNCNISFISNILPEMFGVKSFNSDNSFDKLRLLENSTEGKLWNVLRSLPEATHLGLILPRFLGRLPYGVKTEPTETFYFEEFTTDVQHEHFLWTNPIFICAILLAESFAQSSWELKNNLVQNFDGLPLYYYEENTETKTQPCTEIITTQSNAEIMINQGLMPLISFRDTDRVRVGRFQSIDFSESMLGGKWK